MKIILREKLNLPEIHQASIEIGEVDDRWQHILMKQKDLVGEFVH
jgi:hypothetical protein